MNWITDKKPKTTNPVIVTIKGTMDFEYEIYYTDIGRYDCGHWIVNNRICNEVVAWTKMPKPYKK